MAKIKIREELTGDSFIKDYVIEYGKDYEKWYSGKLIQWGSYYVDNPISNDSTVLYPVSFISPAHVFVQPVWSSTWNYTVTTYNGSKDGFRIKVVNSVNGLGYVGTITIHWHAIGRWK